MKNFIYIYTTIFNTKTTSRLGSLEGSNIDITLALE